MEIFICAVQSRKIVLCFLFDLDTCFKKTACSESERNRTDLHVDKYSSIAFFIYIVSSVFIATGQIFVWTNIRPLYFWRIVWLWLGTSPVHSLLFLHNKDIFCYIGSFLVDSGGFQLNCTTPTTFLLLELVVIKRGHHVVSFSYWQL